MTEITVQQALKSKQNFSDYLNDNMPEIITSTIAEYQSKSGKVVVTIAELTQNFETFINAASDDIVQRQAKPPYFVWIVTNPKENIIKTMQIINNHSKGELGIFIFKASLNGDKLDFECLLKPELVEKQNRVVNTNTPAKLLQKNYWEQYIEVCDVSEHPEMQIKEAMPRHYQNISIGKAGFQILQTVNTINGYVASELLTTDLSMFEYLYDLKDEIEEMIGELEWDRKPNNKTAKIRKIFKFDINHCNDFKEAILEHVKMAAQFKVVADKYLK